jgi:hypothetical protein
MHPHSSTRSVRRAGGLVQILVYLVYREENLFPVVHLCNRLRLLRNSFSDTSAENIACKLLILRSVNIQKFAEINVLVLFQLARLFSTVALPPASGKR